MRHDYLVIGGGIVGLALARALLLRQPASRLLLLEKEETVARHQSGHNSGVIHSGIYYRPGSRKAVTCRQGYDLLLDFCARHDVPHEIRGKIIVATGERELPFLAELQRRGEANGLTGLRWLTPAAMREIEPHVAGVAGLWVPQTGIVDFRVVAERLREVILRRGGEIRCGEAVTGLRQRTDEVEVETGRGSWVAGRVVSCCGLHADRLARLSGAQPPWRIIPFRGEYYTLRPERQGLVRGLVYPVPDPAFPFLGVHFTGMLDGVVEAGPNAVLALKREGYRWADISLRDVADTLAWPGFRKLARRYWRAGLGEMHRSLYKPTFVAALRRLVPELRADDLLPGGAGVRAQACDLEGRLLDDFAFLADRRILHVGNAPSPAATASLAIAEYLCERLVS